MACKIIWSRRALEDLRDIVVYIAAHNQTAAESFGLRLVSKVDLLTNFPRIGRVVPEEHDDDIRELIIPPYRIIYRIMPDDEVVAIARIWHGARGEPEIPRRTED